MPKNINHKGLMHSVTKKMSGFCDTVQGWDCNAIVFSYSKFDN